MGRMERVNEVVRAHDPKLFCKSMDGKLCIFRENWKWVAYTVDNENYYFMRPNHFFIIASTTDWTITADPVDRGLEPIVHRLKEIDLWNRDLAGEVIEQEEKYEESLARDRKNNNEAFLKDFRRQFAQTFNGVNTSSLQKKDSRKIKENKKWQS